MPSNAGFDEAEPHPEFVHARAERRPRLLSAGERIGYGLPVASYPTQQFTAMVALTLTDAGEVVIETATSEMGTGTTQIQAATERLGIAPMRVRFAHG